jgi:hypothetical protein
MSNESGGVDLSSLVTLFYSGDSLGTFEEIDPSQVPEPFRRLLDHHSHMTVALEDFHRAPVDLRVLDVRHDPPHYARKIVLVPRGGSRAVLFGIVRLDSGVLPPEAMRAIRAESEPLGHVLIRQNVLREVERLHLWRVEPGDELRDLFGVGRGVAVYGRTALIHCNSQPAIELLEIVSGASS